MTGPCKQPDIGNPYTTDGRCHRCGYPLRDHKGFWRRWLARTFGSAA